MTKRKLSNIQKNFTAVIYRTALRWFTVDNNPVLCANDDLRTRRFRLSLLSLSSDCRCRSPCVTGGRRQLRAFNNDSAHSRRLFPLIRQWMANRMGE